MIDTTSTLSGQTAAFDDETRPVTIFRPARFSPALLWRAAATLPRYWDLIVVLTRHRLRVRYRQSVLGPVWAVLQPLAMMIIVTVVFSVFTRMPSGGKPYALFAYAGLLPWTAFAAALAAASTSLVAQSTLVTRVYFPREILPLTAVIAALCDLAIASSVLGLLLLYYGIPLTWPVLWVVPVLLTMGALCLGVSLILCAVHVRYRDVGIAMPLLLQLWMFGSPVIYPLESVPESWRLAYLMNPMAGVVDSFRRAVLDGAAPDALAFGLAVGITAVVVPMAYLWFKYVEATMADSI